MIQRKSVRRQIKQLLLLAWLFGLLSLILGAYVIYGCFNVPNNVYILICFVGLLTGGFMIGLVDFWLYDEKQCLKKINSRGRIDGSKN